jgi:hypothetical protein
MIQSKLAIDACSVSMSLPPDVTGYLRNRPITLK